MDENGPPGEEPKKQMPEFKSDAAALIGIGMICLTIIAIVYMFTQ